jgi:hypothetical protein
MDRISRLDDHVILLELFFLSVIREELTLQQTPFFGVVGFKATVRSNRTKGPGSPALKPIVYIPHKGGHSRPYKS